jgi:hypothetical protein
MPTLTEEKLTRLPSQLRGSFPAPKAPRLPVSDNSLADRFALVGLSILILYATVRNICQALVRPFWYDEVSTLLTAQQKNLYVR